MLAFSDACERNKEPILEVLQGTFKASTDVLEVGSGTGQHAVYFGHYLPHLEWQTSELAENIDGVQERLQQEGSNNVKPPLTLDVSQHPWPINDINAIFTANTLHIMSWENVIHFFQGVGNTLKSNGTLCIYGPFRYQGDYTSESNAHFDQYLKSRDSLSGIRDFEAVNQLAENQGLGFIKDYPMPANNQILVWKRS